MRRMGFNMGDHSAWPGSIRHPPPPRQGLSEAGSEAEIAISGTGKLEDHG